MGVLSSKEQPATVDGVHTVHIQDLEPTDRAKDKWRNKYNVDIKMKWSKCQCNRHVYREQDKKPCPCKVLCEDQNNEINGLQHTSNSFLDAVLEAYNNHEDLVLSPDDIWMLICLQFSKHVDENAEQLRHLFVAQEGQKHLEVRTGNERSESEWSEFFTLMKEAIKANTKGDIVDTLSCNFSTSGNVERTLSTLATMSTFKKFFSYGRCIPCCGIGNVHFLGTLDDWNRLNDKLLALKQYEVPNSNIQQDEVVQNKGTKSKRGSWTVFIDRLEPVVDKLIETYRGKPDVAWWNQIINRRYASLGSGGTSYFSGWILTLFNIHSEVESDEIKTLHFDVPVKIVNYCTGERKTVQLIGGFYGVHSHEKKHRPVLSMIVYHDGNHDGNNDGNHDGKAK